MIKVYTDGACQPNPGTGGWAAVILRDGKAEELFGREENTTNNRMEILASVMALSHLPKFSTVNIFTDSEYVRLGITMWIKGWKKRNWMLKGKRGLSGPVKNVDLWKRLDAACSYHNITWHWVRGHNGDEWNERADALAVDAIHSKITASLLPSVGPAELANLVCSFRADLAEQLPMFGI